MNTTISKKQQPRAEDHLRLVWHVITKKFSRTSQSLYKPDDLFQIGCIGLIRACKTYDPNKSATFATYANIVITNEILMALRKETKVANNEMLALYAPIQSQKEGEKLVILDMLEDENATNLDDELAASEIIRYMQSPEFTSKLSKTDKRILELRFQHKTQREIAEDIGITQSYVSRRCLRMKQLLEQKLLSREDKK